MTGSTKSEEILEREKTAVIDELLNVKSNDIKMRTMEREVDVSELILKYFECYTIMAEKQHRYTWEIDDQAVRQLHAASVKLPRVRYFPGSQLKRTPQRSAASCSSEVSARKSQLNRSRQARYDRLRAIKRGDLETDDHVDGREDTEQSLISELASHMVDNDLTPQAVERQLSDVAGTIKGDDDKAEQLHALAVTMVREVLLKASKHVQEFREREEAGESLDDVDGALTRETTSLSEMSITRIESIAKDMVQSVTETVTAMLEAEMAEKEA